MRRLALAVASGVLYFLSFPKTGVWPLAWVFCIPLLVAVEHAGTRKAFLLGLAAGVTAWGGVLYWIALVMNTYGGLNFAASVAVLSVLLVYLALYFAAFAALASVIAPEKSAAFVLPGIWAGLELVRSYAVFGGFPWALLGHSQLPFLPLAQVAEIGGVFTVGAVVMVANVSLYSALRGRIAPLVAALSLVAACTAFGWVRIHSPFDGPPLTVGVAQANVPQDQKWKPALTEGVLSTYLDLSRQALDKGAELVVWPETACTFYLFRNWPYTMRLLDLSDGVDAAFLVGSPAYEQGCLYNRAYLLQKGTVAGYYDKNHLVPFGEYLPFASVLRRYVGGLTAEVGDFCPGSNLEPVGDYGVAICFESVFPGVSRTLVRKGARLLVNISNDAWFKTWSTPSQHLQQACFRAIETRRYLVRSVNHGISAVVDPAGRVVQSIGLLREGVIVEKVALVGAVTLYSRVGPLVPFVWSAASLALACLALTRRRAGDKAKVP